MIISNVISIVDEKIKDPEIVIEGTLMLNTDPVNVTVIPDKITIEQAPDGICPSSHVAASLKSPELMAVQIAFGVPVVVPAGFVSPPAAVVPPGLVSPPAAVVPLGFVSPPAAVVPPGFVSPPAAVVPPVFVSPPAAVVPPELVSLPAAVVPPGFVSPPAAVVVPPELVSPPAAVVSPVFVSPPAAVVDAAEPVSLVRLLGEVDAPVGAPPVLSV